MHKFTTEFLILTFIILWLFNLLTYPRPPIKDVVNSVVIVLLILFWFIL